MRGDQEPDQEPTAGAGPTIGEAARLLGVSENAVRQRIKRRSVAAAKVDGVWRVALDREIDQEHGDQAARAADRQADQEGRPPPDRSGDHQTTTAAPAVAPAARAQLAAIVEEMIGPLVARHEERVADLARSLGRAEAERAGLRAEVERLRAEDAPTAQPGAPSATGAGAAPFAPSVAAWRERTTREVDLDQPSGPAPWWRFWERRR